MERAHHDEGDLLILVWRRSLAGLPESLSSLVKIGVMFRSRLRASWDSRIRELECRNCRRKWRDVCHAATTTRSLVKRYLACPSIFCYSNVVHGFKAMSARKSAATETLEALQNCSWSFSPSSHSWLVGLLLWKHPFSPFKAFPIPNSH